MLLIRSKPQCFVSHRDEAAEEIEVSQKLGSLVTCLFNKEASKQRQEVSHGRY